MSNSQKKMKKNRAVEYRAFLSNETNEVPHFSKNFLSSAGTLFSLGA